MNEKDIHLKLLVNAPIHIDGMGIFKLPKLKEMINMGEDKYNRYLSSMLFSKDALQIESEEIHKYTDFQILSDIIFHDDKFGSDFLSSLEFFFSEKIDIGDQGGIYFGEITEENKFTEEKWNMAKKLVMIGNFMKEQKKEEEVEAGNEQARKFMEKLKKKKAELAKVKKKDENINLHSIISAVACRSVGFDRVGDLTIYQLYDTFYRLGLIDNYHFTFTGLYTGNISGKDIDLTNINWASVIK